MNRYLQFKRPSFFQIKWFYILFIYHFLFIFTAFFQRVNRGYSDAHLYWAQYFDITNDSWFKFAQYGTSFILFLNYPFIKLGLPFWFGFVMYGIIGFFGIIIYIKWIDLVFGNQFLVKGFNILPLFYFMPNLHYWTSSLGKEPLIFLCIASVFYALALNKIKYLVIPIIFILLIRPHVAMLVMASIITVFFFNKKFSLKKRITIALLSFPILFTLVYMVFQLSKIRYWNWSRISYYNDFSITSFKNSGSYIPMLEYSFPYKVFSFYFRPLFYDSNTIWTLLASLDNFFILLLHFVAIIFLILFYKKIQFPEWVKMVFLFTVLSGLLYVQRYANLGIFMRTKIMFHPFTIIGLLYIIKQGITILNSKKI